jgi:hypothetical protein
MFSATIRALGIALALAGPVAANAETHAMDHDPMLVATTRGVPARSPADAGDATAGKVLGQPPREARQDQHDLSMLGALLLGVIGLVWMRRHNAEL